MILVRSPLRISLGGGGTDLPSYYQGHEGFLLAAAINKYIYVSVMNSFSPGLYLKYSKSEQVKSIAEIEHKIIRESLDFLDPQNKQIEISSFAEIPAGTGLGSSGSFTTALLAALHARQGRLINPAELAEQACHVEIERLKEPIGKQDQYIAAFGGLRSFHFHKDNRVTTAKLNLSKETLASLRENLVLFFTGFSRQASSLLLEQKQKTEQADASMLENLHFIKELGLKTKEALERGDTQSFGELMHLHWEEKKRRSDLMSSPQINDWYTRALKNGAIGGKLVGAGGGGFLMFLARDSEKLGQAMKAVGLIRVDFDFEEEGTKLLYSQQAL